DPRRSFIVQAPAGSGKTELLIRRFLRLLGGVQHPEQILAITFTRKAAGEMKARILEALQNAQEGTPPGPDHERDTWALAQKALDRDRHRGWRLLENPARLKVQTIDSFCAGLTRHLPILSRMGGPLSLLENPRPLFWQAASRILARAEADDPIGEAVRTILRHLDNDKSSFLTRIVQLLEKRDQWLIPFFEQFRVPEEARGPLEQTFARLIESILQEADPLIPDELRSPLVSSAAWAGTQLKETQSDHDLVCLKDLERFPEPRIAHLALWKGIARLLLTQTGDYRKPRGINKKLGFPTGPADSPPQTRKQEFLELLETLTPKEELRRILHKIQSLPEPRLSDEEWIVLKATLCLLPEVEQVLRAVFTEQVQTDFTEIALAALNALGTEDEPTDLLLYLDHQIQHILVDEYQDTSYKQRDLLKRLTSGWQPGDGRTLFLVGDPMQSIYRFRDAEVGLFLKTQREGIHEVSLTPLSLTTNFRSQSKIVDWVNTCFQDLFPRQGNEDLGAISYSASRAFRPPNSGDGVVLHPVPHNGNLAETGLQEAREIICLIRTLQEVHPDSSIALLV
ncbi:MAG: UvrD-helicase domain-containing protein, partial [Nitrospinaceae bacterium]|nr:UvrD-helicase domain-containing protein [Nitrospinaceae bacterium]NIR55671.1 UvrD-helicase domain-containing protein [Nitrospinaceae bacterium]NIS86115.1 UvrD-helicase domain-containing protein [Nitrospinaceae bacterium]NIT82959.1 UvrD-helicase domain-containing protein [Nitrospinaceae bacterium]NIU45162.1 UvrD-helicase domain-containing protein [Nitrospinaceae bacterium]